MTATSGESTTWMCRKENVRVNPKHLSWLLVKFCRQEPIKDKHRGTFGKPEVVSSTVPLCLFWAFTKMYNYKYLRISCQHPLFLFAIHWHSLNMYIYCWYIIYISFTWYSIWNIWYKEGVASAVPERDFFRGNTQSDRTPCGPWNHGLPSRFSWQNPIHFCRVPGLFWKSFFRSPSWPKNPF